LLQAPSSKLRAGSTLVIRGGSSSDGKFEVSEEGIREMQQSLDRWMAPKVVPKTVRQRGLLTVPFREMQIDSVLVLQK
jgi:hypothetical protein